MSILKTNKKDIDTLINSNYNPDFDSFERVKTLCALLYKGLESFTLPKKMRIIFIILSVRKFFLNLYMYLFHNRF